MAGNFSYSIVDLGFEPFYILYYHENRFEVGHFQSLRPNHSNQMNDVPEMIEEIAAPRYQSSMISKKSIENTETIQSSQLSEESTQLIPSSQLSDDSKATKKSKP